MLGDTYNKKTEREVTYTVRETWHGSSTVSRSGSFDSVEEAPCSSPVGVGEDVLVLQRC